MPNFAKVRKLTLTFFYLCPSYHGRLVAAAPALVTPFRDCSCRGRSCCSRSRCSQAFCGRPAVANPAVDGCGLSCRRSSAIAPATAACAVVAPTATVHTAVLMLLFCVHPCHGRPAAAVPPRPLMSLLPCNAKYQIPLQPLVLRPFLRGRSCCSCSFCGCSCRRRLYSLPNVTVPWLSLS